MPDLLKRPADFLRIKCRQHPWEFACLSVAEHPFSAVTDSNGDFVIPDVPAGTYQVRALHRKAHSTDEIIREVTAGLVKSRC